jgi:hypothetical protein
VTPLIKVEINECFVTDSNIAINQPKIYQIWGDLCKYYYPDYKKVDDFIKQVKIEKYISKWKFLHLLEPKWDIILSGEANLKDYQKLYEMILEFMSKIQENEIFDLYKYLKNNYKPLEKDKKTGEVKAPWYFKYLVWTDINSVEYSDVELVNEKVGFYKIKLYESKNFGYNINLVKDERPEFNFLTRQCELILYIDNPQRFLEDNNLLFQAILDSPIFIDLKDILNEVIKEREIIYNLIEENKQFFI